MNTTENNILIAEFMGFSLAEEIAPKLYINSKEKKTNVPAPNGLSFLLGLAYGCSGKD